VARASDYASFTPEQRFVAETWRTVDNVYIDRTFNHQNWFKLRQDAVSKKYDTMEEARSEVESMLGSLGDRYTRYLPPAKYDSIVNAATGNLYGVGVELALSKDGDRVVAADVEPTGPAMRGGLRPGDVFLEVDGVRFDDGKATPDDVALVVRGPEGSKVGVVAQREGKTIDFILTREPIKITSVRGYVGEKAGVPGKVGVVRIKNFSGTTADTVKSEIEDLKKKGATSFVLDLRGNPGGLLPGGVDTASLFLEADKAVVFVVNKKGEVDAQRTLADGIDLTSHLVLLVDHNTASAAEVMTAGLKENGRAVVAGEKTFGKGIVQTIRQLESGDGEKYGGVAVTIARYETPEHHDINRQGIPVDVDASVDCGKEDALTCLPKEAFSFGKV
jgi:carboxyl-terminal processing protease